MCVIRYTYIPARVEGREEREQVSRTRPHARESVGPRSRDRTLTHASSVSCVSALLAASVARGIEFACQVLLSFFFSSRDRKRLSCDSLIELLKITILV